MHFSCFSASMLIFCARRMESTDSIQSKSSMACLTLFVCKWPIKCFSTGIVSLANFSFASWMRFSPMQVMPFEIAFSISFTDRFLVTTTSFGASLLSRLIGMSIV